MKAEPLDLKQYAITDDEAALLRELVSSHDAHVRILNSLVYGRGDAASVYVERGSWDEAVLNAALSYRRGA